MHFASLVYIVTCWFVCCRHFQADRTAFGSGHQQHMGTNMTVARRLHSWESFVSRLLKVLNNNNTRKACTANTQRKVSNNWWRSAKCREQCSPKLVQNHYLFYTPWQGYPIAASTSAQLSLLVNKEVCCANAQLN